MALLPNTYRPIVSPEMFGALGPTEGLYGGGPAMVDFSPFLPQAPVAAKAPGGVAPSDVPIMREIKSPGPAPLMPAAKAPSGVAPSDVPIMREIKSPGFAPLMPGAAQTAQSPYARPSLNPSLAFQTQGDQQGYFFVTNRGRAAKTKASRSGFVALNPNAQYRLVNERGKNAIAADGVGEEGLRNAYQIAQRLSAEQGKKADWKLEVFDPAVGRWVVQADDDPKGNLLGTIADIALPVAASFIPGVGPVLGAALGSAASSVAQGRSLTDTLLRAGLSAGGAFAGGQVLGGVGGAGASGVGGSLGGALAAAGPAAQAALNATLPGIVVSGALGSAAGSALGSAAGGALGSAVAGGAGQPTARPPQQPTQQPEGNIVVTGTPQPPGFNVVTGALPGLGAGLPSVIPETIGTPIEVTANPNAPENIDGLTAGAIAAGVLPTGGILPSGQAPTGGEATLESGNSLIDDIIRYYSLGSGALDALGGALGPGGGGQLTPYTPRLGAMPSFARGAFTPFAGDYETYGFGPEFNFFGGTAAPTAPSAGILPPAVQPGPRLA